MVEGEGKDGRKIVRELGIDMYTLLYLKWITSMVWLYGTGNCARCYVTAWIGRGFGENGYLSCARLSPFAFHLKLPPHCSPAMK